MTIDAALARAVDYLEGRGVTEPAVAAEFLLGNVLGRSRSELVVERGRSLSDSELATFEKLAERLGNREPLAYVLGEWGFRRLTLAVDMRALVPRPETEVVVERCLALVSAMREPSILDVGTGSGAIALAIADEHPGARVTAVDSSARALALAEENARRLGIVVKFLRCDLRRGLPSGPYDLVVSNPPYVAQDELSGLEPEVQDWEPREALLDRGQTPAVIRGARDVLKPGGWLVLETHGERAADVARTVARSGYGQPRLTRDLVERERVVEAQWQR
jgi:release factor glutamine methyltransferase